MARGLRYLVETFKQHAAWRTLGFPTWEDYCAKRLQVEPEKVDQWLELPSDPTAAGRYLAARMDRAWVEQMITSFEQSRGDGKTAPPHVGENGRRGRQVNNTSI